MPSKVKRGPHTGSAATRPPQIDGQQQPTRPITDTSSTRPGRMKRRYTPMNSAIGIVIATVKVPQGESPVP